MKLSPNGLKFIAGWEKLRQNSYKDGGGVWTIGYGHTRDVGPNDFCSWEQAELWLREDVEEAETLVNKFIFAPLNQNQFDAMVSFAFNLGHAAFVNDDGSTTQIRRLLNLQNYALAGLQFRRWNKDNGVVVQGLTNRRVAEKELFETPHDA